MLRRFNSLIKGPKGAQVSDDELSELHVSLQPALSVDSSLFTSSQHHHVNPLQQQLARAREESLTRARSTRGGSLNGGVLQQHQGLEEREQAGRALANGHPGFVMGRVPEERSWKEGYEHGTQTLDHSNSLDLPSKLPPPAQSNTETGVQNFTFRPPADAPRVRRTRSGGVVAAAAERTSSQDLHTVVEIPDAQADSGVDLECVRKSYAFSTGPGRTISSWSTDSAAEHCRVCQQRSDEPLIELGCLCRGEMSKSHKSCIEMWFKNKGTNKCEVCQQVATNIPAPETTPAPHFWVWRLGGAYGAAQAQEAQAEVRRAARFHPLWAALGILIAGLLFDVLLSVFLGATALPVNIVIGVLVVLGLGTAVRLALEYIQERNVQRNIRLMELLDNPPATEENSTEGADRPSAQNGPSAV